MIFNRSRQRRYRYRPINLDLVRLVLSIAEEQCPPALLLDWLTDHPLHNHDLSILLYRSTKEYGEDRDYRNDGTTRWERWCDLRSRVESDLWEPKQGMANRCIREVCRYELGIDHLGRTVKS